MAFGFGFNKQKALGAAEKNVQQGKLQNAINEYEKVLKADPKDLTVMNTVGDLYSRLGQTDKALQNFKNVGDAYASQGFTVKAIAMYKKLSKLKPSVDTVLRLAELFTQQGLFNDARAQYLQVAEEFLRAGELEQAVRIFQKTLEMDPENVAMRTRLAEVYIRLNKKKEAWDIFATAVENLRARGSLGAAGEIVQRMLTLEPTNSTALLLRGRLAYDSGDLSAAIQTLEQVADLDSSAEGLNILFQAYIKTGRLNEAGGLGAKLITVHNDSSAINAYADGLVQANRFEDALKVYSQYSDRLLGTDSPRILDTLHGMIGHVRDNTAALETVLSLLKKAGENTHHTEVYELLAHGYVQAGQLEKARDYYQKLTQLEPQNQIHARNYQQVVARLGGTESASLISAEEGTVLVEDLEASSPFIEQRYPDEVAIAVRAALTDAELFISYNMPEKALEPLEAVLPKAPKDQRLNQRLASLHTRAGRFAEAGVAARTLEGIYREAGYPEEAKRYAELATKYESRVSSGDGSAENLSEVPFTPVFSSTLESSLESGISRGASLTPIDPPAPPPAKAAGLFWHAPALVPQKPAEEPVKAASPAAAAKSNAEIDLSEEWDVQVTEPVSTPAPVVQAAKPKGLVPKPVDSEADAITEIVEEVKFYLAQSMVDQAKTGLRKLEKMKADSATVLELRRQIDAAEARSKPEEKEISLDEIEVVSDDAPSLPMGRPLVPPPSINVGGMGGFPHNAAAHSAASQPQASIQPADGLDDLVADLESSLGDSFLGEGGAPRLDIKPTPAPLRTAGSAAAPAPALEAHLAASSFVQQPRTLGTPQSSMAQSSPGIDISDMFSDLKSDLEEDSNVAAEDPETHYNLGVAFREMGLLDEAISELQKVCQAVERGNPFPHLMQAYTWLAQCFLDKGVPEAAIRWYEKALSLPGIDGETCTALHYELGSAYESASNKPLALKHFMEVYGSNIDYRDVAERIKGVKS
jgi:tetratricopeptide (TPR) repeat protein